MVMKIIIEGHPAMRTVYLWLIWGLRTRFWSEEQKKSRINPRTGPVHDEEWEQEEEEQEQDSLVVYSICGFSYPQSRVQCAFYRALKTPKTVSEWHGGADAYNTVRTSLIISTDVEPEDIHPFIHPSIHRPAQKKSMRGIMIWSCLWWCRPYAGAHLVDCNGAGRAWLKRPNDMVWSIWIDNSHCSASSALNHSFGFPFVCDAMLDDAP